LHITKGNHGQRCPAQDRRDGAEAQSCQVSSPQRWPAALTSWQQSMAACLEDCLPRKLACALGPRVFLEFNYICMPTLVCSPSRGNTSAMWPKTPTTSCISMEDAAWHKTPKWTKSLLSGKTFPRLSLSALGAPCQHSWVELTHC
jgi:hypothetical protein